MAREEAPLMPQRFVFCCFCLLLLGGEFSAFAQNTPTVVLLIRHAEKATDDPADPNLNEAGRQRAQTLINVSGDVSVIYTTQYKRTQQTAQPLADKLKLTPTKIDITRENSAGYAAALAKEIRAKHVGRTILVVGHSNTIPQITEALSGVKVPAFEEATEFDRLTVVILPKKGKAQVMQARYGR
jgi:broad specificity phosphatase PhoE